MFEFIPYAKTFGIYPGDSKFIPHVMIFKKYLVVYNEND